MENKVIVLAKDGQWLEMESCFVVGAVEFPDKVVYHKFLFSNCEKETKDEMLRKAGQYLDNMKKGTF